MMMNKKKFVEHKFIVLELLFGKYQILPKLYVML